MKTYVIVNGFMSVAILLFCGYIFYHQKSSDKKQNISSDNPKTIDPTSNWKIIGLIIIAFLLILFSVMAPLLFTSKAISSDFDFTKTGPIGDTIGGLMNPFITLAGVVVTGLAFYIQYQANRQQLILFHEEQRVNTKQLQDQLDNQNKENRIQQFEAQFYEMLRLHRENVTEMEIEGYHFKELKKGMLERYEKNTKGRKVFVVMKTEFECILASYSSSIKPLDKFTFQKCYKLFFSGLDDFKLKFPEDEVHTTILFKARKQHEEPHLLVPPITSNSERKKFPNANLYFNYKPFSGHASRLGHYFRHLYLIVKSVATSDVITDYKDKMKYLRILRAQLSNHEQILLFYNWLGGYGASWENNKHRFFTEYCMIHNLWYDQLFEDAYIADAVNHLRNKQVNERKGRMFEIDP